VEQLVSREAVAGEVPGAFHHLSKAHRAVPGQHGQQGRDDAGHGSAEDARGYLTPLLYVQVNSGRLGRPAMADQRAHRFAGPVIEQESHLAAQGVMGGRFHYSGGQGAGDGGVHRIAPLAQNPHSSLGRQLSAAAHHAPRGPDYRPVGKPSLRAGGYSVMHEWS
jgi:hypothetical protein